jgi:Kdo2-lipid IVA lauroyltransferase/acyltransferase
MSDAGAPRLSLSQRLRYRIETLGFFIAIGFFKLFPLDAASAIGGWIGRTLISPMRVSERARTNLRNAYPGIADAEVTRIVRAMWDNLGRVLAEYGHLDKIHWRAKRPRIDVVDVENFERARAAGKGILLISAHFANWEIMPFAARDYGLSGGVVVRPTNNPYVARWLDRVRARNGLPEMIYKGPQGTRRIFTLLRRGDCICILVDQRASEGIPAPFFGRDAMTTPAPASLALKMGAKIVPVWNERTRGARFRMTVFPALDPPNTGDADRDMVQLTAAINAFVEERVRARPEQWLWIHRRWSDKPSKLRKRAQALSGSGERAESEGSSRV